MGGIRLPGWFCSFMDVRCKHVCCLADLTLNISGVMELVLYLADGWDKTSWMVLQFHGY